jgi:hypothetical protein
LPYLLGRRPGCLRGGKMNKKIILISVLVVLLSAAVNANQLATSVNVKLTSVKFPSWTQVVWNNPNAEVVIDGRCYFEIIETNSDGSQAKLIREHWLYLQKDKSITTSFSKDPTKSYYSRIRCTGTGPGASTNDKNCRQIKSGSYYYMLIHYDYVSYSKRIICPYPPGTGGSGYGYAPSGGDRNLIFNLGAV